MENKNKTLVIVLVAAAAVIGCCFLSFCAGSLVFLSKVDSQKVIEFLNEDDAVIETITPDETQKPTVEPAEPADIPEEVKTGEEVSDTELSDLTPNQLKIVEQAEKIRGISAPVKLSPVYQSEDELRKYLEKEVYDQISDQDYQDEADLETILGFIPPEGFDLKQFYLDLYAEQIAGFYDPETNQMYLVEGISAEENDRTLAHEYTHYLQYNDPKIKEIIDYEDDFCEENNETCLIIDALVEGDATLVEQLMEPVGSSSSESGTDSGTSTGVYDTAPQYFKDSLVWSYVTGFDFVWYQYMKGGFDRINEIYQNLPTSVEQMIHPEKYGKDDPIEINMDPFRLFFEENSEIVTENVLNENDIYELFAAGYNKDWHLSDTKATNASEGWGGGSYIFGRKDGAPYFFAKTAWDTLDDAVEAENAFRDYSNLRFEMNGKDVWTDANGAKVFLFRQDDLVFWMILPDNMEEDSVVDLITHGAAL